MKSNFAATSLALLLAVKPLFSQKQPYPFSRYPASAPYKAKPAPPKLTTRSQREFRTVLRQGAQKGPNFAGHYTVVEWGCGSNCVVFAIVDAANGKIYDRDMPPINDQYPCRLSYLEWLTIRSSARFETVVPSSR